MLSRSPLAAYSFSNDEGANIRVCYQDHHGTIGQIFYDDVQGWHPGTHGVVGRADLNTGIAATVWDGGKEVYIPPSYRFLLRGIVTGS